MVEFALVLPFFFFLIFGTMDGCLLVFSLVSTQFAAAQGDKTAAQAGNTSSPRDADQLALDSVRAVLGPTSIIRVSQVDIYELTPDSLGHLTQVSSHINSYKLDGTRIGTKNWDPVTRNVSNGGSSYIGVKVTYTYALHASFLPGTLPSQFTSTSDGRIEPQTY